jgi:hypothetical protein
METLEHDLNQEWGQHELCCGTDPGKTHYHLEQHRLVPTGI